MFVNMKLIHINKHRNSYNQINSISPKFWNGLGIKKMIMATKRIVTKIGDVFCSEIEGQYERCI